MGADTNAVMPNSANNRLAPRDRNNKYSPIAAKGYPSQKIILPAISDLVRTTGQRKITPNRM